MYALFGAGGHCKVVIDLINSIPFTPGVMFRDFAWGSAPENEITIKVFDDNPVETFALPSLRVIKWVSRVNAASELSALPTTLVLPPVSWIVTIGDNKARKKVVERLNLIDHDYARSMNHPNSTVSRHSSIGCGTVVMANAVINAGAKIGKHCIINSGAVVEHDCVIGDYVHISPNASLAGGVEVGEGTHVGIGACVIPKVKIGEWSVVGAGAVIIKNIPNNATVVGNPGKVIKRADLIGSGSSSF